MPASAYARRWQDNDIPAIAAMPTSLMVSLPLAKGLVMSAVLVAVDVPFFKALLIACVSAIISGAFLLVATHMQAIRAEQIRREVKDVKQALGADKREAD